MAELRTCRNHGVFAAAAADTRRVEQRKSAHGTQARCDLQLMDIEKATFAGIPALIYGASSDKAFLYVHGRYSKKEEAESFARCLFVSPILGMERKNDLDSETSGDVEKSCGWCKGRRRRGRSYFGRTKGVSWNNIFKYA